MITKYGKSDYTIYCGKNENNIVKHAAKELADYINRISGANITVVDTAYKSSKYLIIGNKNLLTKKIKERLNLSLIKDDGFRILSDNKNIYIAGKIDRGTMYGVYYFLDRYFGVRWLSPDFEITPQKETIELPPLDILQNPRFSYREIFNADTEDPFYRAHNRLNGNRWGTHRYFLKYPSAVDSWSEYGPAGGHNLQDITRNKYYFGGQVMMMEDSVRIQCAEYCKKLIAQDGDKYYYNLSQEDNGWSPDPQSRRFADIHGGALAAPLVDMVTDAARRVRRVYPNAHLGTHAYQWSFMPPANMTVPKYVMVEIAPIEADFGHPYTDCTHNLQVYNAFNGWRKIAESLAVWDYIANFQNYLQPLPNIYPMCENIKYFAEIPAIRSYFGQSSYNTKGAEFAVLRAWVASRLLWNPKQNYYTLVKEFCDGYYGPASEYILEYIDQLHQSFLLSSERISSKQRITSNYLNLDFIILADSLLIQADSVAGGEYAEHVGEVRIGVDMTILLREHLYKAEAEKRGIQWKHDNERRERFERNIKKAGVTEYCEDASIKKLLEAMNVMRVNPSVPDIVNGLSKEDWIDFQDMDMNICCGAEIVNDKKASDHGAIKYSGRDWAIQMPMDMLPPGDKWTLYAAVRVKKNKQHSAGDYAFSIGIYPGGENKYLVKDIENNDYHIYRFPAMPVSYQTGKNIWFMCENGAENIYVDRVFAVKEK